MISHEALRNANIYFEVIFDTFAGFKDFYANLRRNTYLYDKL